MAGHVTCKGRGEVHIGFWWGKLGERDHFEDTGVYRRIILNSSLGSGMSACTELIWLRIGTDSCKRGKEPLGFIKFRERLEKLRAG